MNLQEQYIINPAYILRHDESRVILATLNKDFVTDQDTDDEFLTFIHPVQAMIFSFFKKENTLSKTIHDISSFLEKSEENIRKFLKPFIENNETIGTVFEGDKIFFPKNFIISKNKTKLDIREYQASDFIFENVDLKTPRLNTPIDVTLMLNTKCKTNCIYCYADVREKMDCQIPFDRITKLIDEAYNLNMRKFDIMGGEFFLYEHWFDLLKYLKKKKFKPYISTKIPLEYETYKKLQSIGQKEIQFSLDSCDIDILSKKWLVSKDYCAKYIESIKMASDMGFDLYFNCVITKLNSSIEKITEVYDFLETLENVKSFVINPAGYSLYKNNHMEIKPNLNFITSLYDRFDDIKTNSSFKILTSSISTKEGYDDTVANKKNIFSTRGKCTANLVHLYILPDGGVTVCEELMFNDKFIIGNVLSNSIKEIWDANEFSKYYTKKHFSKESICADCEQFEDCRSYGNVCWKEIIYAYGEKKWDFPDPRCPKAPSIENIFYID